MRKFKQLTIWNESMDLVMHIYLITSNFPDIEKYNLRSQMNRSATSIASNIAEGAGRNSDLDFRRFLSIAISSSFELETQLEIAFRLNYFDHEKMNFILNDLNIIQKKINSLIQKLRN